MKPAYSRSASIENPWTKWHPEVLLDLTGYLLVMFLVREVYFEQYDFLANGLFWSFTCFIAAHAFMRLRRVSWRQLGLFTPTSLKRALIATVFIFAFTICSILLMQILTATFALNIAPDQSNSQASSKFGDLSGNWGLFFSILPFIWLQSTLEEMLDRGFLLNWIEGAMSPTLLATIVAVIAQALIFGFRHSYDISERSIIVALIGLAMGIGYVAFGRNLWPLIIAHCALNTLSMLDRV